MKRERLANFAQVLCAGCLEWFKPTELRCTGGHPYCARCYPAGAKGKAVFLGDRQ